MAGTNKLRRSCSFPNLILSFLNLSLLLLSSASLAPTVLLRTPPTSLGIAFLIVSSISLSSSLIGLCSCFSRLCFGTHMSVLLASLPGQVLGVLALFTKERESLSMFESSRDPREAKLLVRVECGVMMGMAVVTCMVVVMTCALHTWWVREYEVMEKKKKRAAKVSVEEDESMAADAAVEKEAPAKKGYAVWVKNDFEG